MKTYFQNLLLAILGRNHGKALAKCDDIFTKAHGNYVVVANMAEAEASRQERIREKAYDKYRAIASKTSNAEYDANHTRTVARGKANKLAQFLEG